MDYMYCELTPEAGQVVNNIAEHCGCDYGPVLGLLVAAGLRLYGSIYDNGPMQHTATCLTREIIKSGTVNPSVWVTAISSASSES